VQAQSGLPVRFPQVVPVASYRIQVALDVEAKTLQAQQTITYANLTQEAIPDLVFHLYLNAFRSADSLFLRESGNLHRGNPWDPEHAGWVQVTDMRVKDGPALEFQEIEDGTLGRAVLPEPVAPGETVVIELEYRAQLPRIFARTGYAGSTIAGKPGAADYFMVGQWFPKLGVWQAGAWNAYPFHANAEFYADFGTYDVEISLPANYVTGGSGLLVSQSGHADGTQTVTYHAEGVIDFAWTASPRFQETRRQVNGVEVLYLYLPEHRWTVERVLDSAEAAITHFSSWFGPYPYPRLTVVDAPEDGQGAGGMEYPTLITAGAMDLLGLGPGFLRLGVDRSIELVVIHEAGHQWWQSMVAFNEAEEPWLDEGLTDFSAVRLAEILFGKEQSAIKVSGFEMSYLDLRRSEYLTFPAVPMYGRAWEFAGLMDYAIASYSKPVVSLSTLEGVLGEEPVLEILSTFFQRYQFSHPTTQDFRSVAQEVAGQDLAWFFDGLVYDDGVLNYRVDGVDDHAVTVVREGSLAIPVDVQVVLTDGSSILERWDGEQAEKTFSYPERPAVSGAMIDPQEKITVDLAWADNGLNRQRDGQAWLAIVSRLLFRFQDWLLVFGGL
jgi:hypothetical protein